MKRFDLMLSINTRAVLATATAALPFLKRSANPHILSLSPPLNLAAQWLKPFIPYTTTKYGMTLLSLGLAEEFRGAGIAVNTLWPRTTIATAAIEFEVGAAMMKISRTPRIMADAAYEVLVTPSRELTGQTLIDEISCANGASAISTSTRSTPPQRNSRAIFTLILNVSAPREAKG